jgi:hypothetical protein
MSFRDINGCAGGNSGEEITVDYYQALKVNGYQIEGDPK